jgi:hypothetical protein
MRGSLSPPFFWAQAVRHMSPTASKNITLFIFSWSVSSRGSGLYQDLLKLTVIQFQQINWNLHFHSSLIIIFPILVIQIAAQHDWNNRKTAIKKTP